MDTTQSQGRLFVQGPGGTLESAIHPPSTRQRSQAAGPSDGERYELRDRFTEVTHRASTFAEMAAKADRLGSSLFVAVAADGRRTSIEKVDGQWRRGPQRPASSAGPTQAPTNRDSPPQPALDSAAADVSRPAQAPDAALLERSEAERAAHVARLEAALSERYAIHRAPLTVGSMTIGRTEYRFRGEGARVAFTESTFRLATEHNNPSVARSMVDVAEARNWRALRVTGHEDFKRRVWLEASMRGFKALGYEPTSEDLQTLRHEQEARQINRIEPVSGPRDAPLAGGKASARGSGGRKAVLAAVEAVLVAKKVPQQQRAAVMAAAAEKLAQRSREGREPRIRVFDKTAPAPHPAASPTPASTREADRSAPAPQR